MSNRFRCDDLKCVFPLNFVLRGRVSVGADPAWVGTTPLHIVY